MFSQHILMQQDWQAGCNSGWRAPVAAVLIAMLAALSGGVRACAAARHRPGLEIAAAIK